jgi:hypothetical protein
MNCHLANCEKAIISSGPIMQDLGGLEGLTIVVHSDTKMVSVHG